MKRLTERLLEKVKVRDSLEINLGLFRSYIEWRGYEISKARSAEETPEGYSATINTNVTINVEDFTTVDFNEDENEANVFLSKEDVDNPAVTGGFFD